MYRLTVNTVEDAIAIVAPRFKRLLDRVALLSEAEDPDYAHTRSVYPHVTSVELTDACPYACTFCSRTIIRRRDHSAFTSGPMTHVLFSQLLDEAWWMGGLQLTGFGEPSTMQDCDWYVGECHKRGIFSHLNSTISRAKPSRIDSMFNAGLDVLTVNLDSAHPTGYERARPGAKWESTLNAIRYISASWPSRLHVRVIDEDESGVNVAAVRELLRSEGIEYAAVVPAFLNSLGGETEVSRRTKAHYTRCTSPHRAVTVRANGDVFLCCKHIHSSLCVGSLNKNSLLGIWGSHRAESLRRDIAEDRGPIECRSCQETDEFCFNSQPNLPFSIIGELGHGIHPIEDRLPPHRISRRPLHRTDEAMGSSGNQTDGTAIRSG